MPAVGSFLRFDSVNHSLLLETLHFPANGLHQSASPSLPGTPQAPSQVPLESTFGLLSLCSPLPWGDLAHVFGLNCQPHTDEPQMSTQTPVLSSTPRGPESTSNPTKTETPSPLQTTPHPVCYLSGKEFLPPNLGSSLIFFPSPSNTNLKIPIFYLSTSVWSH